MACRILVLQPGIEPVPTELGAQSLNHWTAKEVLVMDIFYILIWVVVTWMYPYEKVKLYVHFY